MSLTPTFVTLISRLWVARLERLAGSPVLAVSLAAQELETLTSGLSAALVDRAAFDQLFTIYLDVTGPDPETEVPLPDLIRDHVLATGLEDLHPQEIQELAVMPTWLAGLADALGIPPAGPLLDSDDHSDALRVLIRRHLRAALSLLGDPPTLDTRRVADWLRTQLCGPIRQPTALTRRFYLRVAEELRDARTTQATGNRLTAIPPIERDRATMVAEETAHTASHLVGAPSLPFAELVTGTGALSVPLAEAVRVLQITRPVGAEAFLLRYYGGRTESEIAVLVERSLGHVQRELQITQVTLTATVNWMLEREVRPGHVHRVMPVAQP